MLGINNKPWNKLRGADIQKHLQGADDETFFFEYKLDNVSVNKFIEEVSAFANTFGGYIFVGVSDDKTIEGCTEWSEQRIHTIMHDNISPTPNFDVKKFIIENKKIYVVKIEEGLFPPYITNKGKIYERISSGSFVIKDSNKLSQIYHKREEQLKTIEKKIYLDEITTNNLPQNLNAYLDVGIFVVFTRETKLRQHFYSYDLTKICEYLKGLNIQHSISRMASSFVISIGESSCSNNGKKVLPMAGLHNFIEIMLDGSIKYRILMFSRESDDVGKLEVSDLISINNIFKTIYSMFFEKELKSEFISAQKYEKLTVLKQFTPYYKIENDKLDSLLLNHQKKYGNNLIIANNRFPKSGFFTIDKRAFNEIKIKFNYTNLLNELFYSDYVLMGFIDKDWQII